MLLQYQYTMEHHTEKELDLNANIYTIENQAPNS